MSKAFDKVWHQGLIFKLRSVGVSDSLLCIIESFLSNRSQRVLLNGQPSDWLLIKAGGPQGSILGPLFFLIYINDLSDSLLSTVKLFADDTLFSVVNDSNISANKLNKNLQKTSEWAYRWKMPFNPDFHKQAQEVVFSRKLTKSWWWWIIFVVWLTDKRCLALFPVGTIVRDPHHHESLICCEQDLNLCRIWVQALLSEVVQQW